VKPCTCPARNDHDFLQHALTCPCFRAGLLQVRNEALAGVLACADRIDTYSSHLGNLEVSDPHSHKLNNLRMLLSGESYRLRKLAQGLQKPLNKFDKFRSESASQ